MDKYKIYLSIGIYNYNIAFCNLQKTTYIATNIKFQLKHSLWLYKEIEEVNSKKKIIIVDDDEMKLEKHIKYTV